MNLPHLHRWLPPAKPRAVVQIVHGLAEHAGRYAAFAQELNAAGYAVYAADLPGHGRTAATPNDLGFFAEQEGWHACLDSIESVTCLITGEQPGQPVFLLGHSMGSYLVQQIISEHGERYAGVVLSATDSPHPLLAHIGRLVARLERARLGPRGDSRLLRAFVFGRYNRAVAPTRTAFDWLSRDPSAVDLYLADPLCGRPPSTQLWCDLLHAIPLVARRRLARIPRDLPIHLVAGTHDPISDRLRGVHRLLAAYRRAGLTRVSHQFYPEARHELLHETNRAEVMRELIAWFDATLAGR